MDSSEEFAEKYLIGLGCGDVVFEPDGNRPPDFVVGGRIAVEVRRLNQNFEHQGGYEGLEIAEAALWRLMEKSLPLFGPPIDGASWWVSFDFHRPLDWKPLKVAFKRALREFRNAPATGPVTLTIAENFEIDLHPASIPLDTFYALGAGSDRESGGFIFGEIVRNFKICSGEKARKVAPFRADYPEWWLILVDRIGAFLQDDERKSVREHVTRDPWDKVIMLDPRDAARVIEL